MTTEASRPEPAHPPRRRKARASKGSLRAFAWVGASASFLASWVAIGLTPKPVSATSATPRPHRKVIQVHRIIRRIVVTHDAPQAAPSAPQVHVIYVGGGSSGGSTGSSSGVSSGTTRCSGC